MSSPTILTFAPLDVDTHHAFLLTAHRETSALTFGTAYSDEQIAREIERERGIGTGVFWDDTLVGICDMEHRSLDDTPYGWVHFFYLTPHLRGQGLGTQLIDHAVQFCRERSLAHLYLRVGKPNTTAYHFYIRNGFVPALVPAIQRPGEYALVKAITL